MREMKDSGIAWIGEIPSDWRLIRFKDKYRNVKEIVGDNVAQYERLALTLNGVIKRPKEDDKGLQPKEFSGYQILRENDFIFKMIDLQNISTSRVGLSPYTGLVSPAYIRFTPRNENSFNLFTYYFLMSMYYNCVFNNLGGEGVRSALNASDMGTLIIPYPSETNQKEIASRIENETKKVDVLIANQEQQIEKLKAYKQSLITEVVTKGLNPDAPMKPSGVEWICDIPEKWEVAPLKALFDFGKGLPITKENLIKSGIPVISYGQIHAKWNSGVTTHETLKCYVSEDYLETNPQSLVKFGDFIFADTSEDRDGCGNCAYVDTNETLFAGYHTIILKSKKANENKYLAYLFLTDVWRSQIRERVSGVKLFSVSRKIIGDTTVILPDSAHEIVSFLDIRCAKIDRLIEIKQQKIDKLSDYKKSLIYEYVTGKKEV